MHGEFETVLSSKDTEPSSLQANWIIEMDMTFIVRVCDSLHLLIGCLACTITLGPIHCIYGSM